MYISERSIYRHMSFQRIDNLAALLLKEFLRETKLKHQLLVFPSPTSTTCDYYYIQDRGEKSVYATVTLIIRAPYKLRIKLSH